MVKSVQMVDQQDTLKIAEWWLQRDCSVQPTAERVGGGHRDLSPHSGRNCAVAVVEPEIDRLRLYRALSWSLTECKVSDKKTMWMRKMQSDIL